MADFTSRAIKEAFIALLEERPLSEITIKEIASKCGINRNSFYYHYQDLPTLIEEIIKEEAESIIEKYPSVNSMVECFDAMIEFASHRKKTIMHIFHSVNREVFERSLMDVSYYFVCSYFDTVEIDIPMTDSDKRSCIAYYKSVCFGLVMEWLNCGMSEEFADDIRRIFLLKKDFGKEVTEILKDQV